MRTVTIAFFLIALCLPKVQEIFHLVPMAPVYEVRARVPTPRGNPLVQLWTDRDYFSEYEKHYNDVFGFRDFFIRLRNQVEFSFFKESEQIVLGRDGWISDRSSIEVQQKQVDDLTDAQWARLGQRIAHLKTILHKRGVDLLIVPIPIKNTVYPELFPEYSALRPAVTGEARFRQLLVQVGVPYVDVFKILSSKRHGLNLYYKTDNHWNEAGAADVAEAIVNQLAQEYNRHVRWTYPKKFAMRSFQGGSEGNVMATLWQIPDTEPFVDYPERSCGALVRHDEQPNLSYLRFDNTCRGPLLPPTTMFGNSFMIQLQSVGLQDYFRTFYRVHDLSYFHEVLSAVQPGTKIVIWQLFELEIGYQLQSDEWWRQVDATP